MLVSREKTIGMRWAMAIVLVTVLIGSVFTWYWFLTAVHYEDRLGGFWAQKFYQVPDAERLGRYMKDLSKTAHVAGSSQNYDAALYVKELWEEWGIPNVMMEDYYVLLSYPVSVAVSVETGSGVYHAQLKEDVIDEDPTSGDPVALGAFHGYSSSGNVTATLIYSNYCRREDFKVLEDLGYNVSGKIVLCRYGKIFRGNKVNEAEVRGAVGVIIYSDPVDDGASRGDVYPDGPYRPPSSFQRGSVFLGQGDPQTPGLPSTKNASRISLEDLRKTNVLPNIPSVPMSYGDAEYFLRVLKGDSVPPEWQGGLPFDYKFEGGVVNLNVEMDFTVRTIWNVVAEIKGDIESDRYVLFGCHRDAWTLGAGDPISGTTTLLEISRAFGEMYTSGWKPRRTIKIASWDAEEAGLIGSFEFVENHYYELQHRAVVYFNLDVAVEGMDRISVESVASMGSALRNISKVLPHPFDPKLTIYDMWKKTEDAEKGELQFLGSGSDFTGFLQEIGIASCHMLYDSYSNTVGEYASVYHSNYDSYTWMSTYGDPGFVLHKSLAQFMGISIMTFADARVLPFDYTEFPTILRATFKNIQSDIEEYIIDKKGYNLSLDRIYHSINLFESKAKELQEYAVEMSKKNVFQQNELSLRALNDVLAFTERTFINYEGISDRKFIRHMAYAPGVHNSYGSTLFPSISDLIMEDNPQPKLIEYEIGVISVFLERTANFMDTKQLVS